VGVADALRHLGLLAHLRGRYADAERDLRSSADLFARVSSPGDETTALVRLSGVLVSTGRLDEATRVASHAVERAALYPNRRLDANGAAGRARDAIEQYELALVLAEEFGLREEQCAALLGLAASRIALGARAAGVATAEQALELARSRGYQLLEGEALALLVEAVG
jgi:tetratricopeptide (TPR) repeat protein